MTKKLKKLVFTDLRMGLFDRLANVLGLRKKECNVLGKILNFNAVCEHDTYINPLGHGRISRPITNIENGIKRYIHSLFFFKKGLKIWPSKKNLNQNLHLWIFSKNSFRNKLHTNFVILCLRTLKMLKACHENNKSTFESWNNFKMTVHSQLLQNYVSPVKTDILWMTKLAHGVRS